MFLQQHIMKDPPTAGLLESLVKQIAPVKSLIGEFLYCSRDPTANSIPDAL